MVGRRPIMTFVFILQQAEAKCGSGQAELCGESEVLTKSVRHVTDNLDYNALLKGYGNECYAS